MTRKPGRPPKDAGEPNATMRIQVKMTPEEKRALDQTVVENASSISDVVRKALKKDRLLDRYKHPDGEIILVDPVNNKQVIIYL